MYKRQALHKAKQLEKELHKSGKLFRIPTMNGIIETTCPEDVYKRQQMYIPINAAIKIKITDHWHYIQLLAIIDTYQQCILF